jgi:HlyD family type I secretion membrane fusion protein
VRELAAKELYPRMKLIAVEQQVAETDGQLAKAQQSLATARAELEEARSRLTGLDRDRHAAVLAELATVSAEEEQLERQIEAQDVLVRGLVVMAPVAGTVQELQVSAIGQSVAANQPMMKLIPSDAGLVVEARVRNEDVGHIREGMPVRLKVHAFDFVRFGALEGRIEKIASDARRDQPEAAPAYSVTIVTTGADHAGRGPVPRIQAGMLVDAEIEIGRRTVLGYFTDRLRRIGDEAFSEM